MQVPFRVGYLGLLKVKFDRHRTDLHTVNYDYLPANFFVVPIIETNPKCRGDGRLYPYRLVPKPAHV